jgi:hypothetical protein
MSEGHERIENHKAKSQQVEQTPESIEWKKLMEDFYARYFETPNEGVRRISLENLQELKEKGVSTEQFLDYLCQNHGYLLHGSLSEIQGDKLVSEVGEIFASNKSAIAILKSVYSNRGVDLKYPYRIREDSPLDLKIEVPTDGQYITADRGYVYVVNSDGFRNNPEGSWQFIKESKEVEFHTIVETEKDDFKYPVTIRKGGGEKEKGQKI